ncbi:cytochrome P450 [Suillus clintonianus]|uniref:cytochrome P450 n=1 Tax=Suillus clintonianus TaxID=1904413 RepID=UPI001B86F9FE|nr:cytochrome P450 [Suillus clintonianus]KAG2125389.1 cytochrome P450 [Suillus clintonianus]
MPDRNVTGGLVGLLAAAVIGVAIRNYFAKPKLPRGVRFPPGPVSLPILGSALAIDVNAPWITYKAWGSQYGDVVYTTLFGQDNIVINSEEIARDLLENRSQNYSDRPEIATNELFGVDHTTAFMRYNSRWRLHRKIYHQSFRHDVTSNFRPMQLAKTHELLMNLLEDPSGYPKHLEVHAGSIIMSAVYSYDAARRNDHEIERMALALEVILQEMRPEVAAIFSAFPSLLRLPSWLPGMRLKRVSPLAKQLAVENLENPFAHAEHRLAAGTASSCMVVDHLLKLDESDGDSEWQKKAIKDSAATATGAGTETTAAVIMNFILVMILYPDMQEKARKLIESVVGTKRLPTFEDRPSLPYIDAILRECLRWRPVFPLAIMHAAVESDVYEGYYIPKGMRVPPDLIKFMLIYSAGATITPNVWAMCHNEAKYPNPDEFNPDRFLNADGTLTDDTVSIVWGFGRRICPGRHLAESSVWSAMVHILAIFKLSIAKDESGNEIKFKPRWDGGITVRPVPFPCSITPRNAGMDIAALHHLIKVSD